MHRWLFVGLALMAAVGGVGTALVSGNRVQNPALGLELIAMSEETSSGGFLDEQARSDEPFARPSIPNPEDIAELMKSAEQLRDEHTTRLKAIVAEFGWPGKRLVGFDGAHAAYLLLQQADDKQFRAEAVRLMQELPRGQVDAYDLAQATDRVDVEQDRPQTYATQVGCNRDTGEVEVVGGVDDPASVDKRRAEIGLPPLRSEFRDADYRFGGCEVGN